MAAKKTVAKEKTKSKPFSLERDERGLLTSVDYVYNEDGFVDWRKMIKQKYLYPNPDRGFDNNVDVSTLSDKDLISTLAGMKELLAIRGYNSVHYKLNAGSDFVCATCTIEWIPNFETEGRTQVFSSTSSATLYNTSGLMSDYLAECAENRAFARCIRNFLKIGIPSREELFQKRNAPRNRQDEVAIQGTTESFGEQPIPVNPANSRLTEKAKGKVLQGKVQAPERRVVSEAYQQPHHTALDNILTDKKITFPTLKKSILERIEEFDFKDQVIVDRWESIADIPAQACITIMGRLKAKGN
jgi:hypothetical protein